MDAGKRTINDIFNGNRILEIPFFQRAYVWGEDQWQRLLDDMEAISIANKPYFLGSLILKQQQKPTGSSVGDVRTVIDGQQRITTLNIFFKVLCLKNAQTHLFDRTFRLNDFNIALLHNRHDLQSFKKVLNLTSLDEIGDGDNILAAYNYFKEFLNPDKLHIQNILGSVLFVGIDLDVSEDEQQIFDTINSLGVKLTTAELLKNYFFNRDDLASYSEFWEEVFEKDDEIRGYWDKEITTGRLKRTFIDLFFYSYLQIKIQESTLKVKTDDKIEFSKVETLFDSYKKLIKDYHLDKKDILSEIKEYAQLFYENFSHDIIENELTSKFGIDRVNAIIFGLDTSTLIPYVLYVLRNVDDENERNLIFEFLECYLMRRMVVHASTKNYNQLFNERLISNEVLSRKQLVDYIEKSSDKVNYMPNDEQLKHGFESSYLVNKQAAGILYFIESKIRNRRRHGTQLLGISKYSLEHLMPKKWENHWGRVSNKDERDYRNQILYTLGNLAIITQSLNASIRDANWKTKKKGKSNKDGLIQYSAGIETLSSYLELDQWNETEIEKRARFLYNKAVKMWSIED